MIDVTTLTNLITQFRNTTASNSVSPETVGSILQKLCDVLATAGTQANLDIVNQWHEALRAAAPALTALSQGNADRNHVYLNAKSVNLYSGATADLSPIQIQQATTERAGAMRAQQVSDLNAARNDVRTIKTQIETINTKLSGLSSAQSYNPISCLAVEGSLYVRGAEQYTAQGYVPYIFRRVRKRNPYKSKFLDDATRKYCREKKGWGVFGSVYSVKLENNRLMFSTNAHHKWCVEASGWSGNPETLVTKHVNANGNTTFGWGRSSVLLDDVRNKGSHRMIHLRFAVAFGKRMTPDTRNITPKDMVSPLAEFSLRYDPQLRSWSFGS